MSLTTDGQRVVCDGDGCQAQARLPVALRPRLSRARPAPSPIHGWLFTTDAAGPRHFCPACLPAALERLAADPEPLAADPD